MTETALNLAKETTVNENDYTNLTLAELEALPTLTVGQADDLKIDDGNVRVWLSRMTKADGMARNHEVTVERYTGSRWIEASTYEAK